MDAVINTTSTVSAGMMRPLNIFRDLPSVADLIELCFSTTLDSEGRSFIDQMRQNGRNPGFLKWAPRVIESVSLPLSGFVWESHGKVVGNVSLIPFKKHGQNIYLIANVATHPDYRRQGIARKLTIAAMNRAREKKAESIWLHVRDDNPEACHLYEQLGFIEKARRTTWHLSSADSSPVLYPNSDITINSKPVWDWATQSRWLERAYPAHLGWYSHQTWDIFKPGLLKAIYRLLADISIFQISAYRKGKIQGVFNCSYSGGSSDHLWAALPESVDPDVVLRLSSYILRMVHGTRNVVFEYPVGSADDVFRSAGMKPHRTLVWMEAPGVQLS